jgi:hypothetical protein
MLSWMDVTTAKFLHKLYYTYVTINVTVVSEKLAAYFGI